jgi:hypothetical protein
MNRVLTRPIGTKRMRRYARLFLVFLGALAIYVLSIGPVFRICGANPLIGFAGIPTFVRAFYAPLFASNVEFINRPLDHYLSYWIENDRAMIPKPSLHLSIYTTNSEGSMHESGILFSGRKNFGGSIKKNSGEVSYEDTATLLSIKTNGFLVSYQVYAATGARTVSNSITCFFPYDTLIETQMVGYGINTTQILARIVGKFY